mmetsp:Transcript_7052/g.9174  ORF Transcript_7052/g.9174 Transcript_7052/m.9174 type:complete len:238 (+) Transcript_7052:2-715(+)
MGLASGGQMLYSAQGITHDGLLTIVRHRAAARESTEPSIYFDCNWLAMKWAKASPTPVTKIIQLATAFALNGVYVTLTVDGKLRHHSKKATINRDAAAEQARYDSILSRAKLQGLVQQSRSGTLSENEQEELKNKIESLEKKVQSKEDRVRQRGMIRNLSEALQEATSSLDPDLLKFIKFVEAKTQADCVICHAAVHDFCDAAVANDGDFPMVAGDKMLLINNFCSWYPTQQSCRCH